MNPVSQELAEAIKRMEEDSPLYKKPLRRRFVDNPSGQPLKTKVAEHFPLLPRRERRLLVRNLNKSRAIGKTL